MMYHWTNFGLQRTSSSEKVAGSYILIILALAVTLTFKIVQFFLHDTLAPDAHLNTKFGNKNVSEFWKFIGFILCKFGNDKAIFHWHLVSKARIKHTKKFIKKINYIILIAKMCISISKNTNSPFSLVVMLENQLLVRNVWMKLILTWEKDLQIIMNYVKISRNSKWGGGGIEATVDSLCPMNSSSSYTHTHTFTHTHSHYFSLSHSFIPSVSNTRCIIHTATHTWSWYTCDKYLFQNLFALQCASEGECIVPDGCILSEWVGVGGWGMVTKRFAVQMI